MSCVLGVIARSTSSYTGPAGTIGTPLPDSCLFVIGRSASSSTGPAGAIGTSLPDVCLVSEPNQITNARYN